MKVYKITGKVIRSDTREGIKGLRVEAWDKDLLVNDLIGSAITGERGVFRIQFDDSYFKEIFLDRRPDLFFKVFKGSKLIKSTEDSVLWNMKREDIEQTIEVKEVNDMTTPKNNAVNVRQKGSEIFKFVTLRPFQRQDGAEIEKKKVLCYRPVIVQENESSDGQVDLHTELYKLRSGQTAPAEGVGLREAMEEEARKFINSENKYKGFVGDIHDLSKPVSGGEYKSKSAISPGPEKSALGRLEEWIFRAGKPIVYDHLQAEIKNVYNNNINDIVQGEDFKSDVNRLQDTLMALAIVPSYPHPHRDRLVNALRICRIIERMAEDDAGLRQSYGIDKAMKAPVVLPADIFPLPPAKAMEDEAPSEQENESEETLGRLREKRRILKTAIEELHHLRPDDYVLPSPAGESLVSQLNSKDIEKLSTSTKAFLEKLDIDLEKDALPEAMNRLAVERGKADEAKAPALQAAMEELLELLASRLPKQEVQPEEKEMAVVAEQGRPWTLKQEAIDRLQETTRQAIQELGFDLTRDQVFHVVNALEKELTRVGTQLFRPPRRKRVICHGMSRMEFLPMWEQLPQPWQPGGIARVPQTKGLVQPAGIGEYNTVRQTLVRYEPGEIAHIENVLRGEYKERVHRRLRRMEEEVTYEEERKTVTEKDLQSTDRFELKREASETIKEEHKAEAGVTVKYDGPMVDVEAKAGYQGSYAKEQAKKTSVSYAREVTEKSLSRLEEKIREVRVEKSIEEFEETNTHGIDNKDKPDHAVGIYRWVDKVYEAQVINYGARLFFDFVVPEPAAFYLYALTHGATTELEEPVPPMVDENGDPCGEDDSQARPLGPDNIEPDNYMTWVKLYGVSGIEPPPTLCIAKGYSYSIKRSEAGGEENTETPLYDSRTIPIPKGYRAMSISVDLSHPLLLNTYLSIAGNNYRHTDNNDYPVMYKDDNFQGHSFMIRSELRMPNLNVHSDDNDKWNDIVSSIRVPRGWIVFVTKHANFTGTCWYFTEDVDMPELKEIGLHDATTSVEAFPPRSFYQRDIPLDSEDFIGDGGDQSGVPVTVAVRGVEGYVMNVVLRCKRTDELLRKWQLKTYDAIIQAYLNKKAEYEENLAMAATQEGVSISGRNPGQNREIEETELKRCTLSMITGQHFECFNAMQTDSQGWPGIDFAEAEAEGAYIRFFEQAFDWPLMTYLFYPYFWGRRSAAWDGGPTWIDKITRIQDVDPLFEKFLKAGAARVRVPVRPGFEEAILHYLSTGEIWNGGEEPTIDDPLLLDIVEELRQQQGAYVEKSEGTITVENGDAQVIGTGTNFEESDVDHDIYIEGRRHVIAEVQDTAHLTLTEPYRGESRQHARYYIGARLVGGPWEVRVPTSLVYLQEDAALPEFGEEG